MGQAMVSGKTQVHIKGLRCREGPKPISKGFRRRREGPKSISEGSGRTNRAGFSSRFPFRYLRALEDSAKMHAGIAPPVPPGWKLCLIDRVRPTWHDVPRA